MTIVKLKGGLGNQMFQYACGRNISLLHKSNLKLDLSFFSQPLSPDTTPRAYNLAFFSIVEDIAKPEEIAAAAGLTPTAAIFKKIKNRLFGIPPEPSPELLKKKNISYLDGYWQSEDYFKENSAIILKEFRLKNEFHSAAKQESEKITKAQNSVALHIRRGDYVQNTLTNSLLGVCPPEYYDRAVAYLKEKIGTLTLFIFSDDIEWAKTHMKFSADTHYISRPDIPDYEEMMLMSMCKHAVIANSSFSWWAAWLNPNPSKVVIAPSRWFQDPALAAAHKNIVPQSWIRL